MSTPEIKAEKALSEILDLVKALQNYFAQNYSSNAETARKKASAPT